MNRCRRCDGFVPLSVDTCPNCRSGRKAWWMVPVTLAGAGVAAVTLSACYGAACAVKVTYVDGGVRDTGGVTSCQQSVDCRVPPSDGGDAVQWRYYCEEKSAADAGVDGGAPGDGGVDGGQI